MPKVLIIDDDVGVPLALQAVLSQTGYDAQVAPDAEEGLALAQNQEFDVVVADLYWAVAGSTRLEPKGLDLIAQLRQVKPEIPVIFITALPATETTIEASKLGAYDYITKPKPTNEAELTELLNTVREAAASRETKPPSLPLGGLPTREQAILGRSRAMQVVFKEIGRVAAKPVSVLIRGETGTGKELVARALHRHGDRSAEPFVVVNCATLNESLLESELFGHEAGSFTDAKSRRIGRFEQANGGTIFLDEIGDISPGTQAKFLRVLQERTIQRLGGEDTLPVDVRVIAATHQDLEQAVEEKKFRLDLYYRLNDEVIHLPPLRDRTEDIPELAHYFIQLYGREFGVARSTVDPDVWDHLKRHPWPGNVRELQNTVRKALLLTRGRSIDLDVIRQALAETRIIPCDHPLPNALPSSVAGQTLDGYISELLDSAQRGEREDVSVVVTEWAEREIYRQAICQAEGDQTKAAQWLGVSRPTIRQKLSRYGLHVTKSGSSKRWSP